MAVRATWSNTKSSENCAMQSGASSTPARAKSNATSSPHSSGSDPRFTVKIVVPFKSVPDPYAGAGEAAKSVINPFDEIAIEEALRIRERGESSEVVGVTIGPAAIDEQIRSALAMGMNRAFRIDDARALDPYAVARILRVFIEKEA